MWTLGGPPGPAGWDRRRLGARLRAAFAGLQELQGLRATQQERVRGALALQPPPAPAAPAAPAAPCGPHGLHGPEQQLEAALAALQEQLSRLRQQDIGLKTHLDQLDLQISKLQLDVGTASGEALDSDSRPSSGFYEMSDGGSCSLSTSCASVCSDHISPSLGSLLPVALAHKARPGMGDWRPRSVDETTVPAWRPQATEEGARPPGSVEDAGQPWGTFWPRPVSTGDLDRALPADTGLQKANTDAELLGLLCQGVDIPLHVPDPKYRQDLVSQGGREVYPYPSPLHAVALQSPLFVLTKETPQRGGPSSPRESPLGPAGLNTIQTGTVLKASPARARAYIDRLLHLWGRETPAKGSGGEQGPLRHAASPSPQRQGGWSTDGGGRLLVFASGREDEGGPAQSRGAGRGGPQQQGSMPLEGPQHPGSLPEEGSKLSNSCILRETMARPSPSLKAQQTPPAQDYGRGNILSPSRMLDKSPSPASGHFAHPSFAVSLKMGPPKSKAEKIKRRPTDKMLRHHCSPRWPGGSIAAGSPLWRSRPGPAWPAVLSLTWGPPGPWPGEQVAHWPGAGPHWSARTPTPGATQSPPSTRPSVTRGSRQSSRRPARESPVTTPPTDSETMSPAAATRRVAPRAGTVAWHRAMWRPGTRSWPGPRRSRSARGHSCPPCPSCAVLRPPRP
nr:dapper homolog 2 isoform X2 [Pongo pygmaeus]